MQLLKYLLKEKGIVIRERTPITIILYSVFLYLCRFSLRDVMVTIRIYIKRSRTAIWKWVQKFGKRLKYGKLPKTNEIVSGGFRNYIERVIETVKDRTRIMDHYFLKYKMENRSCQILDGFLCVLL